MIIIGRVNIVQTDISPKVICRFNTKAIYRFNTKAIYRFNTIHVKIPMTFISTGINC